MNRAQRAAPPPHDEALDLVTPGWRRFLTEYWRPAYRQNACSLDELLRLRKAVPYLQASIEDCIAQKEAAQ